VGERGRGGEERGGERGRNPKRGLHTMTVLELTSLLTALTLTFLVISSTGAWRILMPKYPAALSKAAWAVTGTTLR